MSTRQTWLITGGCGFIGTRLVQRLHGRPETVVRVLDNLSVGSLAALQAVVPASIAPAEELAAAEPGGPVRVLVGDIRELETVRRAAMGSTVIVHLAANTGVIPSIEAPLEDCTTNIVGTLHVLEAARTAGAQRVVFASSGAPLGAQTPPIHEEKVARPVSPYGASKLAGEAYCHVYAHAFDVPTVALRFGNVYGPGSTHKGSVVAKFIREALAGERLTVYGDGSQTRDFIHVDDLVDAIEASVSAELSGELFQIATGAETSVNEIVDALRGALGRHGRSLDVHYTEPRKGEVVRNFSDVTKAQRMLGWRARHGSISEGIASTLEWFLSQESR